MDSPAPSNNGENNFGKPKAGLEQITFRFCSECSNMLYPKEDEDAHKLQFTCRTCQYTEEASTQCIFRNVLNNAAGETAGVTQDVGQDPTVGNPSLASLIQDGGSGDGETAGDVPCCTHCGEPIMDYFSFHAEARAERDDEPEYDNTMQLTLAMLIEQEELEAEENEDEGCDWEETYNRNSQEWEDRFQEGLLERVFPEANEAPSTIMC